MNHYNDYNINVKIILIGDANVGKTTYYNKLIGNEYYYPSPTIGVDYMRLYKEYNGNKITINLWDTAGQEKFMSIITSYFNNVAGIILMFDLSRYETYINLQNWINLINEENTCNHKHLILIIGNKCDLKNIIPNNDLEILKNEKNVIYKEVSCKDWDITALEGLIDNLVIKIIDNDNEKTCKGITDKNIIKYSDSKKITMEDIKERNNNCCIIN
jgi:small GTP-binding protein